VNIAQKQAFEQMSKLATEITFAWLPRVMGR